MKIAIIGGGSTYTPELIKGFLDRAQVLPVDEICLMDIDHHRLEIVGGLARRMVAEKGDPFNFVFCDNLQTTIKDASYVITQLRVGQMQARRQDEYLGKKYGLIGQETTGIGGMAKALRTIPVVMEIAQIMQDLTPHALLINFANPSGLVTEALQTFAPEVQSVGVCNAAFTTKMAIIEEIKKNLDMPINLDHAFIKTLGLNHLTWYYDFLIEGQSLWPLIMEKYLEKLAAQPDPEFDPDLIYSLGMIPNSYLKYYYHTQHMLEKQAAWPPSRAEVVMQIEAGLLKQFADDELKDLPEELMLRGGAWYSTVAVECIQAHFNDTGAEQVLNTTQAGAVKEWEPTWVMELPCRVYKKGIEPISCNPLPADRYAIIKVIKEYERLTARAAVLGDRELAREALLKHPLGPDEKHVDALLEDMLFTHRAYLPLFFKQ